MHWTSRFLLAAQRSTLNAQPSTSGREIFSNRSACGFVFRRRHSAVGIRFHGESPGAWKEFPDILTRIAPLNQNMAGRVGPSAPTWFRIIAARCDRRALPDGSWAGWLSNLRSPYFLHPRLGVVIGNATQRVHHAASKQDISFRPVNLQIAARNRRQENAAFESAEIIGQNDAISIL